MDEHSLENIEARLGRMEECARRESDKRDALGIALALACLGLLTLSAVASAIILAVKL